MNQNDFMRRQNVNRLKGEADDNVPSALTRKPEFDRVMNIDRQPQYNPIDATEDETMDFNNEQELEPIDEDFEQLEDIEDDEDFM